MLAPGPKLDSKSEHVLLRAPPPEDGEHRSGVCHLLRTDWTNTVSKAYADSPSEFGVTWAYVVGHVVDGGNGAFQYQHVVHAIGFNIESDRKRYSFINNSYPR